MSNNNQHLSKDHWISTTTGYKGVYFYKRSNRYHAIICVSGKRTYLGSFAPPKEAAHAYDRAAIKYFGEFAYLNFPEEWVNRDPGFENLGFMSGLSQKTIQFLRIAWAG